MKPRPVIFTLALSLQLWCAQAAATSVLPMSTERMASAAAVIFHGRVTGNEVLQDEASGQVATVTEFEVIEAVKGDPGDTYTVKQVGGQLPGNNKRLVIHGVPEFSLGEEYVVFLPKASSLGFASPIGLSQGKFDVHRLNGKAIVSNDRTRSAVVNVQQALPAMPSAVEAGPAAAPPAGTELADFLQTVRGMVRE